jgi:hypothetical protein
MLVDSALSPWVVLEEAGVTGGALQVALDVTGAQRTCGDCAVVAARVLGGKPPYTYAWSGGALSGPGPHEVCDKESKTYEVTVSDTSLTSPDDPTPSAMKHSASAQLSCSPATPQSSSELNGCKLLLDASILSGLNPNGVYVERVYGCHDFNGGAGVPSAIVTDPDAGAMPMYMGQGFDIPEGLKAGKSYQLTFELLLPFTLGGDVRMELYGSREGCSLDEKLTDVKWQGIARQSWCLTPQHDYKKLLIKPSDGGEPPLFSISFGVSATICSSCDAKK